MDQCGEQEVPIISYFQSESSRKSKSLSRLYSRSSAPRHEVSFVDTVPREEEPRVGIKHIGMRQGNVAVKVEAYNDRDVRALEGTGVLTAEVAQPPTASYLSWYHHTARCRT